MNVWLAPERLLRIDTQKNQTFRNTVDRKVLGQRLVQNCSLFDADLHSLQIVGGNALLDLQIGCKGRSEFRYLLFVVHTSVFGGNISNRLGVNLATDTLSIRQSMQNVDSKTFKADTNLNQSLETLRTD